MLNNHILTTEVFLTEENSIEITQTRRLDADFDFSNFEAEVKEPSSFFSSPDGEDFSYF